MSERAPCLTKLKPMWEKIKKALYNEVPDEVVVDKKAENVSSPLITNTTAQNQTYVPNQVLAENSFAVQPSQPPISEEDKKNYQNYFNTLYNKTKIQCSDYGKFLADIDTIVEGDNTLPEANKFRMAFNFSRKAGVTKERLIANVNDAIAYIQNDKTAVFDTDVKEKNAAIQNNCNLIEKNRLAIQKLNEEISRLQTDNEKSKNRITVRTLLYNTLQQQLIAKVQNDIVGITNFIQ